MQFTDEDDQNKVEHTLEGGDRWASTLKAVRTKTRKQIAPQLCHGRLGTKMKWAQTGFVKNKSLK